jgi:hypothetical protein
MLTAMLVQMAFQVADLRGGSRVRVGPSYHIKLNCNCFKIKCFQGVNWHFMRQNDRRKEQVVPEVPIPMVQGVLYWYLNISLDTDFQYQICHFKR